MVYNNSEQLAGVLNAYNFGVNGDKPNLTVQLRFFKENQSRGQTKEEPFMLQSAEIALTIFDIPLNIPNFADPGDYTIQIKVTDHIKNVTLEEEIEIVVIEGE